jgi:signal transduction histidine kinase/DNA-binding response OmpR family regulator
MSLRVKVLLVLVCVMASSFLVGFVILKSRVHPAFDELQSRLAENDLSRVEWALEATAKYMDAMAREYTQWDETYAFVQGEHASYVDENFYANFFPDFDVNAILFYDLQGRLVWGDTWDYATEEAIPLDEILFEPLTPHHLLLAHDSPKSVVMGLMETRQGPMVVISEPVVRTDMTGPVMGSLVFGRLLGARKMAELRDQTHVDFRVASARDAGLSAIDRAAYDELESSGVAAVRREDSEVVSHYTILPDIHGAPTFLLRIQTPLEIAALGTNALNGALIFLLLTGLLLAAAIWVFFRRLVLAPVAALRQHIRGIRKSGDLTRRLSMRRSDELGELAGQFDAMTGELEVAQQEMAEARDAALEVARLKSEFLATMSHEIRTPMNGVVGMTELLLGTELDFQQKRFAQGIQHSADGLLAVINDVLDLSKLEAGRVELEDRDFELRDLVEEVAFMFAASSQAKGLEMLCEIPPDLELACTGDPGRLRQILVNLVGNALKFTQRGEIVVGVEVAEESVTERRVHFSVRDTGIGISEEDRRHIFDSFTQADASTTRQFGGTGLGLAISRKLVEFMGGSIEVESEPGRGSTFSFTIPLERAEGAVVEVRGAPASVRGVRVLVVDDNATNREILYHQLSAWEMHCTTVTGGEEALVALRGATRLGAPFGLAILDLHMPGMDGLQLARAIRADARYADIPLVMLSSVLLAGDAEERRHAGIHAHLVKPIRQSELFDILVTVLGGGGVSNGTHSEAAAEAVPESSTMAGGRVLLVEDNPVNREVAVAMLEQFGCEIEVAKNGLEAVQALEQASYDIVLMDCQMPVMDGYEATAQIRRREASEGSGRRVSIVALTANAVEGDREKCLAADMDDYLSKPFTMAALKDALERWIDAGAGGKGMDESTRGANAVTPEPETATEPESPALDLAAIAQLRELESPKHPTLVADVMRAYADNSIELTEELSAAVEEESADRINQAAHALKSSSRNVGAAPLGALCETLEAMGRGGDLAGSKDLLEKLLLEHRRVITALQSEGLIRG